MLNELGAKASEIAQSKGFSPAQWEYIENVATKLALIHSEVSEALEDVRHDNREHFGEELADVIIRVVQLGYDIGVDLDEEVSRKMLKNSQREHRHGGKRA